MDIDSINVGSTWGFLMVMMFVNVTINCLDMQEPMQDGIEEIVHDIEWNQRQKDVLTNICQTVHGRLWSGHRSVAQCPWPQDIGFVVSVQEVKVYEGRRGSLANADEQQIFSTQIIQMFTPYWNQLGTHPF